MEAPVITRQRRPFLAPLWVMALSGLAVVILLVAGYRSLATTTVVLVRHAEKELSTIDDPPLAPEGELRAARLAQMFGKPGGVGRVRAVYISDTRRARMTAAPVAARLRLQPVVLPGSDVKALARRVMHDHRGQAVLVVAHSDTLPEIIERISGLTVAPIGDDEYDLVYVVSVPTLGKASVLRLAY
jgi:broad specificity phosphatase PhoE